MEWLAITYSLPSSAKSSARVAVWRRLQRVGAVAPAGNLYLLPNRPDCLETFQWLSQEVNQAGGQALVTQCEAIAGFSEAQLIDLFCEARRDDYGDVQAEIEAIQGRLELVPNEREFAAMIDQVGKLSRQLTEIGQIDYFACPQGQKVRGELAALSHRLGGQTGEPEVAQLTAATYQRRIWVTRPQPHVDRLSTIWLIKRFVDSDAEFCFRTEARADEVSFDMVGAEFGHVGTLCTFETVMRSFGLEVQGLPLLAEIIHQIDLQDDRYQHSEAVGIDMVLRGWLASGLTDEALVERGFALFDGLLASCAERK